MLILTAEENNQQGRSAAKDRSPTTESCVVEKRDKKTPGPKEFYPEKAGVLYYDDFEEKQLYSIKYPATRQTLSVSSITVTVSVTVT